MPIEAEIVLNDGTIISTPDKISEFNRSKFQSRVAFEDKVFMAVLRDSKRAEFKNNPVALREHICGRFDITKGYYFAITKTKTMAISPTNRAQLEAMLLTHIGQVLTDHQNIRSHSLENAWRVATSDKDKILLEVNISEGNHANGEPNNTISKKYTTREEGAYKWFHRVVSDHKILYETLKPFITRQFVEQLGDHEIENAEDMLRELDRLKEEMNHRKHKEAV